MVLQPDLSTWTYGVLPHRPIAVGLGTDGFLFARGVPGWVTLIRALDSEREDLRPREVRVPFPLAFFLRHRPWGYTGPWGAWPDGEGGLLVAATGAELDRTVALGLAHLDATGALVAGPVRVASTETPLETSPLPVPLAAGVDGAGRMLVVWWDGASCDQSGAAISFAARWYRGDGTPLGDPFDVELDDYPIAMMRLGDGSLAVMTLRGAFAARFADGIRGVGPVPAPFADLDARRLARIPGGYAIIDPPCVHPDRQGRIEVLNSSGNSCGVLALPPLAMCAKDAGNDVAVGHDGTIATREYDLDLGHCVYRIWPGAIRAP